MSPPSLLVIGRYGQVSRALQRQAGERPDAPPLVAAGRPELDLASPAAELAARLEDLLTALGPTLVINAAAYTAVDRAESESDLAQAVNATAVGVLAGACARRGIPLVHLSTDYVFDGSGERPWREDDPTGPLGVYGASKLAGEAALREAGGPHLLLRVSWVFGQEGANFVRTMLRLAAQRPALQVVSDQVGGPTSAESIATTLLTLAEPMTRDRSPLDRSARFPWGTYHYAGVPVVSWFGFASEIFRQAVELGLVDRVPELTSIPTSAYPTPASRPGNSRLDCGRFRQAFGLPLPDWRSDLRTCLQTWSATASPITS
jgi:dTDP-4-dehydrorhamnose reductase